MRNCPKAFIFSYYLKANINVEINEAFAEFIKFSYKI